MPEEIKYVNSPTEIPSGFNSTILNIHLSINSYLEQIKSHLPAEIVNNKTELQNILDEIEEHIIDHAHDLSGKGPLTDTAIQDAIRLFGEPISIADAYRKTSQELLTIKPIETKQISTNNDTYFKNLNLPNSFDTSPQLKRYFGNLTSRFVWILIKALFFNNPFLCGPTPIYFVISSLILFETLINCTIIGMEQFTPKRAYQLQYSLLFIRILNIFAFSMSFAPGYIFLAIPIYAYGTLSSIRYLRRIKKDLYEHKISPDFQIGTFYWKHEKPERHIHWEFDLRKETIWVLVKLFNLWVLGLSMIYNSYDSRYMIPFYIVLYLAVIEMTIWGLQYIFHEKSYVIQSAINIIGIIMSISVIGVIFFEIFTFNYISIMFFSIIMIVISIINLIPRFLRYNKKKETLDIEPKIGA